MVATAKPDWKFLTNHALVLGWIAMRPESTAREIALAIGITERTALKIVGELDASGYLTRRRQGRRNIYHVNPEIPLRHLGKEIPVGELLKVIAPKRRRRAVQELPSGSRITRLKKARTA